MVRRFLATPYGAVLIVLLCSTAGSINYGTADDLTTINGVVGGAWAAVIGFVVAPIILGHFLFGETAADSLVRLPQPTVRSLRDTALVFLALVPIALFVARRSEFQAYYGVQGQLKDAFLLSTVVLTIPYYFAEEFLFRGFLFHRLWTAIGAWAMLVDATLFTLAHVGKPPIEVGLAFVIALGLSWLSWRSKSFLPAAVVHYSISLLLTVLVTFVWVSPGAPNAPFHH